LQGPPSETECVEPEAMISVKGPGQVTTIAVRNTDDLTLRHIRALQSADVIHVVGRCSPSILDFARREAKRITHRAVGQVVPQKDAGNIVIIRS